MTMKGRACGLPLSPAQTRRLMSRNSPVEHDQLGYLEFLFPRVSHASELVPWWYLNSTVCDHRTRQCGGVEVG